MKFSILEYWPSLFDYLHTEGQYGGVYKIIGSLTAAYEPFGNDYSICLSTKHNPFCPLRSGMMGPCKEGQRPTTLCKR